MARPKSRKRQRSTTDLSISQLRHRMTNALSRGAFQKAQELANTLYKREPTPQNRQYVVEAAVNHTVQLRRTGKGANALPALKKLVTDGISDPTWAMLCLRELLLAGDWETATTLHDQLPSDSWPVELPDLQVDVVLLQGEDSLGYLPDAIQADARAVWQALSDLEHGRDAAAEAAVADLAEPSSFHDWKCLVQGFVAFYQGADALAHWRSLTPSRVPATLAAPFQAQLDPTCLTEHPNPDAVIAFGRRQLQDGWLVELENAQQAISTEEMGQILTYANLAVDHLPSELQALRDRLAHTMYWLMAKHGTIEELDFYTEIFPAPPDDPSLHRLQALMHEQYDDKAKAQRAWAAYAAELDQYPTIRAEDHALARGLIWFHMGEIAERMTPPSPMGGFPFFPGFRNEKPAFNGLHCYQQSAKLAPALLIAHETYIDRLHTAGKQREKVKAARALLKQFPEHEQTLVTLADDAFRRDRWDQALTFQTRAVDARPHVDELRAKLGFYELGLARLRAQQGKFDAARSILTAHIENATPLEKTRLLCRQAAVELKAGEQALGDALYDQAQAEGLSPITAMLHMLIEAVRMPVDTTWIRSLERKFRQELKGEWHAQSACYLLSTLTSFASQSITYEAYEQHQKWVFQYLRRGLKAPLSEAELCHLCVGLKYFPAQKLFFDYARRGQKEYRKHPLFPMSVAIYHITHDPEKCPWDKADALLHTAHNLASDDLAHADLIPAIDALLETVHHAINMQQFSRVRRFTPSFGNPFDDDDDDDDDDMSPFEAMNALHTLERLLGNLIDDDDDDDDDDDSSIFDFFNPFGPPPGGRRGRGRSQAKKRRRKR